MWIDDDTIKCDTCPVVIVHPGRVLNAARAKGWHILEGQTMGGDFKVQYLCSQCVGSPRSRLPEAAPPLNDDQTLF